MPAGFQVFNIYGDALQVDGQYINYSLRKSGYITNGMPFDNGVDGRHYLVDITEMNRPVIATKTTSSSGLVSVEVVRPKGEYPGYVAGRLYARFSFASSTTWVAYYIFDQWVAPRGNTGIEVFNSAGQVVFHSDWLTLKVVDVLTVSSNVPTYEDSTHTIGSIPSGCALIQTYTRSTTRAPSGTYPSTYRTGVWTEGTTVKMRFVFVGIYGTSSSSGFNSGMSLPILVVDTTELPVPYG